MLFESENEWACSYTICVVLAVIALTISIGIGAYFAYKYTNRNKKTDAKESFNYPATLPCWTCIWVKSKKQTSKIEHITFSMTWLVLKVFDSNLDKKINKKLNKNIDIYYIGYITIKKIGDYENI